MQYALLLLALVITVYSVQVPHILDEQLDASQVLTGSISDYYSQNPILERKVTELVSSMSNEQLAGQVLMPAWERGVSKGTLKSWVCKQQIGGFMILGVQASRQSIAELQSYAKACEHSTKLFVSIDAEPTLIAWNMRVKQLAAVMQPASALGTVASVSKFANIIHTELARVGVTMNFAPVVDSNANQAIISERSFGGSAEHIKKMAQAFNTSAIAHNIIPTIKHFPGHGSVSGDSHKGLVTAPASLPELGNFEVSKGSLWTPLLMVGHIAVRGGEHDTHGLPATLSPIMMQGLLREELGYNGLIITDAMNMGAVSKLSNTTVRALKAGADIVLMPMNTSKAHKEILKEMQKDAEFKKLIKQKVARIIKLKVAQDWAK